MKAHEISQLAGCTLRSAYSFLAGSGFSKKRAERLEAMTGISRLHWAWPTQYKEDGEPFPTQEVQQ